MKRAVVNRLINEEQACNRMYSRLQPYVLKAATVGVHGYSLHRMRLQPAFAYGYSLHLHCRRSRATAVT